MKFTTVLALACLVIGSFAVETDEEAYLTLRKIEQSKFGRTLLDTIQLQLEAGDPVEDLLNLLKEMENKIQEEQGEDDEFIEVLQKECDEELKKLEDEIAQAKARIEQLEAELAEKIPIRDEKVRLLAEKEEFKALIEERLVELEDHKIQREADWALEQEEHDKAAYVIQRAKEIIMGAMKGDAFLQKKNYSTALAQVSAHLMQHVKKTNFRRKSLNAMFKILATITASAPVQADKSGVERIIDLCDQLLMKIAASREIERKDFQHWMSEYEATKEGLNTKLSEVIAQISNLEGEIATLNKRIQMCQDERAEQLKRVEEKTQQHKDKLTYCDDENVAYAERREKRDGDREVISDAIGLLQSKLRTFRKYVSGRTDEIKKAD